MKKLILMFAFFFSILTISNVTFAVNSKYQGEIDYVNTTKRNITINKVPYKLSNTIKVYGFNGDKYLNVKKLTASMFVKFKYSKQKGSNTVSEIWVQPN